MDSCQLIRTETKMEVAHLKAYEESWLATSTKTVATQVSAG
jgi:hypothetical protein